MILNDTQSRQLRRFNNIITFHEDNASVYANYEPYNLAYQKTKANFIILKSYIPQKDYDAAMAATDTKQDKREDIDEKLYLVTCLSLAYANTIEDNKLIALFKISESAIAKLKDGDVLPYVTQVTNAVTPLLKNADYKKYGITTADVTALLADATAFDGMLGASSGRFGEATVANENIDKTIKTITENINAQKLLLVRFRKTNPDFVEKFNIANKLDKLGVRHYGVDAKVFATKGGDTVPDAIVTNGKKQVIATADENGAFKVKLGRGQRSITVTDPLTKKSLTLKLFLNKAGYLPLVINLDGTE